MKFEIINLGTEENPQNANLRLGCTPSEQTSFINILKKYKDIFSWTCNDLKTYDTSVIQHVIPLKYEAKPFQQKLRKNYPDTKQQIKKESNKLLQTRIIFYVKHSQWVSNMVLVRNKNGDICICIDFRNLNKASEKYNFPLPPMEQILQSVVGSEMMSFLDGFSGYNQVLVSKNDKLKMTFQTKWGTYAYRKNVILINK